MVRRMGILVVCVLGSCLLVSSVSAISRYRIVRELALDAIYADISNKGDISGMGEKAPNDYEAFVITDGNLRWLSDNSGEAVSISDNGRYACGVVFDQEYGIPAVRWELSKREQKMDILSPYQFGEAYGVNDKGETVGGNYLTLSDGFEHFHPTLWTSNGRQIDLGDLGGDWGYATAINNKTEVVGISSDSQNNWCAFYWDKGRIYNLGMLYPGYTLPNGLNDKDEAVGYAYNINEGAGHAFYWSKKLRLTPLNDNSALDSEAVDINAHSTIVGHAIYGPPNSPYDEEKAVIWENGIPYLLNDLVSGVSPNFFMASAINDSGDIVARGSTGDGIHTYLLSPSKGK